MNATSLFISCTRLVMLADVSNRESWSELYRLFPYLRSSLSCTVCESLLKDPISPPDIHCSHHVCKKCRGGKKKLRPLCNWCKDYSAYADNVSLKIQLQSYKKLCECTMQSELYNKITEYSQCEDDSDADVTSSKHLLEFIEEGAKYTDSYENNSHLTKSSYSVLPNVLTSASSTTPLTASSTADANILTPKDPPQIRTLSNGTDLYSVSYAGPGNKITIKRKAAEETESGETARENSDNSPVFKKPQGRSKNAMLGKRRGCRCGNATAMPGKLTCCGQRCPCYVECKPCYDCKCKGCRNPHRTSGYKVCPVINLDSSIPVTAAQDSGGSSSHTCSDLDPEEELNLNRLNSGNVQVYAPSQLKEATNVVPSTIAMAHPRIINVPVVSRSIIKIPSIQIPKVQLQTINKGN